MTQAVAWSTSARTRPAVTVERALLAAAFVAGIALRVYVYRSVLGNEDSDEAVLGLMVRHATHGHLTTFLWGEAYGGTLEVLLTVPVFWLFGAHGDLVPPFDPKVHWQPYQRAVRAAPHGFVFFTRFPPPHGVVRTLRAYGYTRHAISRFVVYAPPVRAGTAAGT